MNSILQYWKTRILHKSKHISLRKRIFFWNLKNESVQVHNSVQTFTIVLVSLSLLGSMLSVYVHSSRMYDSAVRANGEVITCYMSESTPLDMLTQKIMIMDSHIQSLNISNIEATNYF